MVGDLAALKARYAELKAAGEAKKAEIAEARKAAQAKAVAERTTIVEKAEALAASLGDNTNWRSTADKFRNLFDEWQNHQRTTVRIDKPEAEALWKRFSAARTTFNQARRKWAQARDNERTAAKEAKEAIIAEANELKDSTAWGETSRKFNDLMDRWKKAGRAGRNEDDELWAKFREAADTFFNARQADRDQINSSEKENLAAKEALLVKAEALVPVKTDAEAKKARQELAKIQEEWDQIGYVPRDDMRRIENRLDAVDKQIKAIEDAAWKQTDPEADARKSSFEEQLNAQLAELDAEIAAESDPREGQAGGGEGHQGAVVERHQVRVSPGAPQRGELAARLTEGSLRLYRKLPSVAYGDSSPQRGERRHIYAVFSCPILITSPHSSSVTQQLVSYA